MSRMGERWFVGAGTATHTTVFRDGTDHEDRPELIHEITRMRDLFVGLGYRAAPEFQVDLDRTMFTARLRDFLKARAEDDTVVAYYTGHGVDDGRLYLPMADATDDVVFSSLPAADLIGRLLAGTTATGEPLVRLRRLLFILDTCYSGAAMPKTPPRTPNGSSPICAARRQPV